MIEQRHYQVNYPDILVDAGGLRYAHPDVMRW